MDPSFVAFDVDGTVWPFDLEDTWLRHLVDEGELPQQSVTTNRAFLRQHEDGTLDEGAYLRFFLGIFKGKRSDEMRDLARRIFAERVQSRIYAEVPEAIEAWRRRCPFVFLLTAANQVCAAPVAEYLQVDALIATELALDAAGRYTGSIVEPYCYGSGKLEKARELCREKGWSVRDGVYYADSESDVPMLTAVGRSVVVNPTTDRMAKLASSNGWEVVRWSAPDDAGESEPG